MTTRERRQQFNRKPKKKVSLRNELVAKYGRSCWLCGRGIAYDAVLSIDHVRPLSKGGSSKIHNLRLAPNAATGSVATAVFRCCCSNRICE